MKNLHKNPKPVMQEAEICTDLKKKISRVGDQGGSRNWVSLVGITPLLSSPT